MASAHGTPALEAKVPHNRQMRLMANARLQTSFDPREISIVLHGGLSNLQKREEAFTRVEAALGTNDMAKLPLKYANMDRLQSYHQGLAAGKVLMEEQTTHRHGVFDRATHHYSLINESPFGLQPAMFIPTLKLQASAEQLAYWLPLAESGRIIGTYCQTELGHGTFLRGLETTATFDEASDGFILHSPTVTSTKYWPGGLGFSCSHAIVMAKLIIRSKDYGVHPFVVQLRSLEDYTPMPGIELGDVGLKYGLNQTDNGYAIFTNCYLPRSHLLMKNAQVLRDGTYIKAPHNKLAYATMIFTRNLIVHTVAFQLGQAATIATRYSVVREQGVGQGDFDGRKEIAIISYKSQHQRLLTHMARAFALVFASQACERVYQGVVADQAEGNHQGLAYGHITTAALKAYATQVAADGAEDCRKCCGGHGYSLLSGLPDIVVTVTPTATLEGENYVMYQQTARYLVKMVNSIRHGHSVDPPMQYLADGYNMMYPGISAADLAHTLDPVLPNYDIVNFSDPTTQLTIIQHRAARLIIESESLLRETGTTTTLSVNECWNTHMMTLISAARAHAELFVVRSFISAIAALPPSVSNPSRAVLQSLCTLYALDCVTNPSPLSPSYLEHTSLTAQHLRTMRAVVDDTLLALLPNAIGITDSWGFTDASLASALGVWDGNVYETLMAWTKQIPINQLAKVQGGLERAGYQKYTRAMLQAKL